MICGIRRKRRVPAAPYYKRWRSGGDKVAWRIVVRLDDGRYATVTQRENPGLRQGDYVEVRGDHVYPR